MGVTSDLYDSSGNIVGVIEAFKDITDKKMSDEFLKPSLQDREVLLKEILSLPQLSSRLHPGFYHLIHVHSRGSKGLLQYLLGCCKLQETVGSILRLFCGKRSIPFLGLTSPSKIPAMRIPYDLEG